VYLDFMAACYARDSFLASAASPLDETTSAFMLKKGSLGKLKSHTLRAFHRKEMERVLAKIK
jgi:hypothetical protein